MLITLKTDHITTCEGCGTTDQRYTYKIERRYFCRFCATRKIFRKKTKITDDLVQQFDNDINYKEKLDIVENIITNGEGTRKMRVKAAKIQTNIPLDIRNLGHGRYIILCPAGKRVFNAPNHINPTQSKPFIDPDCPFESICDHVQAAMNKGLPINQVAEYIWSIRGSYDYITAMMYPHQSKVVVTWPHGQKELYV